MSKSLPEVVFRLIFKSFLLVWDCWTYCQSTTPPKTGQQKSTADQPPSTPASKAISDKIIVALIPYLSIRRRTYITFVGAEVAINLLVLLSRYASLERVVGVDVEVLLSPIFFISSILCIAGWKIRARCYEVMQEHFTFSITVLKDHKLITSGPYSTVWHPSYTGMLMVALGSVATLYTSSTWLRDTPTAVWLLISALKFAWSVHVMLPTVVLLFRISAEDELLKKKFGKDFNATGLPLLMVSSSFHRKFNFQRNPLAE
ncbi:hypothetical protein AX16_003969 [Volvariella volvacea WC 439]|nr:hypothetical protein AX16_003969 [Volvariella volvacea WC 439]